MTLVPTTRIDTDVAIVGSGFAGSLLAHTATIRLHIAREAWLPKAQGLPGCTTCVSILKHKLATMGGTAQVLINFADQVQP